MWATLGQEHSKEKGGRGRRLSEQAWINYLYQLKHCLGRIRIQNSDWELKEYLLILLSVVRELRTKKSGVFKIHYARWKDNWLKREADDSKACMP